jgi:hypothetical protein
LPGLKKPAGQTVAEGRARLEREVKALHIRPLRSGFALGARIRAGLRRIRERECGHSHFLDDGFAVRWDNNAAKR